MRLACIALALVACTGLSARPALAQTLARLNLGPGGVEANGSTGAVKSSADGRFVAFESTATNLVANDLNGAVRDIFVLDRNTGVIELVSRSDSGAQSTSPSTLGGISDDGNWIAFRGNGLEVGAVDDPEDVYLRDRLPQQTRELTGFNVPGTYVGVPAMAGTGQYTVFQVDEMCSSDLLVYDTGAPQTLVLATGSTCYAGGGRVVDYTVSRDGTRVLYSTWVWFIPIGTDAYVSTKTLPNSAPVTLHSVVGIPSGYRPICKAISNDGLLAIWRVPNAAGLPKGLLALDVPTNTLTRIDPTANNVVDHATNLSISTDRRLLAFVSSSNKLVPSDTNGAPDAFAYDFATNECRRVSLSLSQQQAAAGAISLAVDSAFSTAFLSSAQSDWVSGDTNGAADLFARDLCFSVHPDQDQDGYGVSGVSQLACLPIPAGWRTDDGDCDDSNAAIHPLAPELPNGIDDDCDGLVDETTGTTYCTSATSSSGCTPLLGASGSPSISATSGLVLQVAQADGQRSALIQYGIAPLAQSLSPSHPSTLCVAGPRQRLGATSLGGSAGQCDGGMSLDFLAWISTHPGALHTPLVAGQQLYFQAYVREPNFPPPAILLSAGLTFVLTP
jgi:Tol biopolymer transport system component